MASVAANPANANSTPEKYVPPSRGTLLWRYLRRNKGIMLGFIILLLLGLFTVQGMYRFTIGEGLRLTDRVARAYPLAVRSKQPPYLVTWLCSVGILNTCEEAKPAAAPAPTAAPKGSSPSATAAPDFGALPGINGPEPTKAPDFGALPGIDGPAPTKAPASSDFGALPGIGGETSSTSTTSAPNTDKYWLGTDWYGRDLHAAMVVGLWQSALIGVFAGLIATIIPVVLGFLAAYFGGKLDRVITAICSVLQPIPPFLIQVVLAASLPRNDLFDDAKPFQTIAIIGAIVAITAWMKPTLVIRSQVLSMKERMFVNVAKLSGMGSWEIIFKELLPNLLPFIVASFINAIFDALFSSFGLSVLGLAPLTEPLLGNIIYFAQQQSAIFNGWWWWPLWPVTALILIFAALTLINTGLDEVANPRARRTE